MASLIIALRDGFANDLVIIHVNDREVFHEKKVTTNLMRGYAGSFEVQLPPGNSEVKVSLPSRDLSKIIVLEAKEGEIYLGLSIRDGKIEHEVSGKPFKQL